MSEFENSSFRQAFEHDGGVFLLDEVDPMREIDYVIHSIEQGQWSEAKRFFTALNVTFKELAEEGVSARDIAVLADMVV